MSMESPQKSKDQQVAEIRTAAVVKMQEIDDAFRRGEKPGRYSQLSRLQDELSRLRTKLIELGFSGDQVGKMLDDWKGERSN